ncbi:sensor histidine kinase [Nonomuraea lactucae]|uniref:sensor histidine kinase n=1 Tax=Nonomuraea lactucae TaxID=2249762 RepID=UPI000DE45231|nr:histidine kinase [Nonomuraea lactucae]
MSAGRVTKLDKVRWLIVYSTDFINVIALIGFVDIYFSWEAGFPAPLAVAAGVLLIVLVAMSTRPFRIAVRGGPRPTAILAVSGAITLLLSVIPLIYATALWLGMLAPFVRRRTIVAASAAAVLALNVYVALVRGPAWQLVVLQVLMTAVVVGGVLANLWLWRVAKDAHDGQEAKARLAVSEERLRFARDLNDLLGQSLAGISARTARAEETLRADPAAAAAEMFEVRDLTRRALREVRGAVQNYRALDLDEVLSSVRAVLEAAGVRCAVDADTAPLAPETRTLLATVVREGATNVLKHSRAEHCRITIRNGVLEMSNDGVSGPVGDHAPNGLGGLAQRVGSAGGSLSASPTHEGTYLLRAVMPA